jgi:HAD superfamily hydrolase (TIGR01450 family)
MDFSPYDAVLLDLDGTIYHENHPLPGAIELIRRLEREGTCYACLTNSGMSPRQLEAKLAGLGVRVDASHIYSCPAATADYVMETFAPRRALLHGSVQASDAERPRIFNLATDGLHELLEGKVHWVESPEEECDAVCCASPAHSFASKERQWIALQLLRRGAKLIGLCADRLYPSPRGVEFGAGSMTALLAYAANVTPIFCGKPEAVFFHELCRRLKVAPDRCILIGDNLESDIAGAKGVGMAAILALCGVTRREDVAEAKVQPDRVIGDLRELL